VLAGAKRSGVEAHLLLHGLPTRNRPEGQLPANALAILPLARLDVRAAQSEVGFQQEVERDRLLDQVQAAAVRVDVGNLNDAQRFQPALVDPADARDLADAQRLDEAADGGSVGGDEALAIRLVDVGGDFGQHLVGRDAGRDRQARLGLDGGPHFGNDLLRAAAGRHEERGDVQVGLVQRSRRHRFVVAAQDIHNLPAISEAVSAKTAGTFLLAALYLAKSGGTMIKCGHSFLATKLAIADRQPNLRAS
jgi:hypothetical protein